MEGLHESGISDEVILGIQGDLDEAPVSDRLRALLYVAEGLTLYPSDVGWAVEEALETGWTDAEVASAVFIISFFNMKVRIVEAFGLPPDESHPYDPTAGIPMLRCGE